MPPLGTLLSPSGKPVFPAPYRAPLAALLLGAALLEQFSAEQAADLVRRTSDRQAERWEQHAAGVSRRREQSAQAQSVFEPGTMREAKP